MSKPAMFLAMILTNARRSAASAVTIAVEKSTPRAEMLFPDGRAQPLPTPPAEVLLEILQKLESGQREFASNVYAVEIQAVMVRRGIESLSASISEWSVTAE